MNKVPLLIFGTAAATILTACLGGDYHLTFVTEQEGEEEVIDDPRQMIADCLTPLSNPIIPADRFIPIPLSETDHIIEATEEFSDELQRFKQDIGIQLSNWARIPLPQLAAWFSGELPASAPPADMTISLQKAGASQYDCPANSLHCGTTNMMFTLGDNRDVQNARFTYMSLEARDSFRCFTQKFLDPDRDTTLRISILTFVKGEDDPGGIEVNFQRQLGSVNISNDNTEHNSFHFGASNQMHYDFISSHDWNIDPALHPYNNSIERTINTSIDGLYPPEGEIRSTVVFMPAADLSLHQVDDSE